MTDDTLAPSAQQGRLFIPLASSLAQIIEDRFDDDQYDQAVELLEQLRAEGIRPPQHLLQKLVALSLCSLSPARVASSSRWTLNHELDFIASRLVSQPKIKGGSGPNATERPSTASVLKATSLLVQYSRPSPRHEAEGREEQNSIDCDPQSALLARHVLKSLPSQRKPLKIRESTSSKRSRSASVRSDSEHDSSVELSSVEKWVRNDLQHAEDIWDLLCNRRLSSADAEHQGSLTQVCEFWMKASEQRRYQKQLQATVAAHDRLEDKLGKLNRMELNGETSSESSSDDDDDDGLRKGMSNPGRLNKRPAKSKGSQARTAASPLPAKRIRKDRTDLEHESHSQRLTMTEGAWRTLSALLLLWERACPTSSATLPSSSNDPPLLWQFPINRQSKTSRRTTNNDASGQTMVDDISRALDVAFSFPHVLPALTSPPSNATNSASNLFATDKALASHSDVRVLSSVPQTELFHRQQIGEQKTERDMAARAETAAHLLQSLHELVKLGFVQSVAFFAGASERVEPLRTAEIQYLMLALIEHRPIIVVKVLAAYLEDAAEPHSDQRNAKAPASMRMRFDQDTSITLDTMVAHAMPTDETAHVRLRNIVRQDRDDHDAKAILDFLSLHSLELDSSGSSLDLEFPTKSESFSQPIVRKRLQRQNKSGSHPRKKGGTGSKGGDVGKDADTAVTLEMRKGGLQGLAFVRALEMEARDRINQIKFLIARALVAMHSDACLGEAIGEDDSKPLTVLSDDHNPDLGPSRNAGREQNAKTRRAELRSFLSQLIKAFKRDSADFEACLSSMKTHLDGTPKQRRQLKAHTQVAPNGAGEQSGGLPTLGSTADRCQECLVATRRLIDATMILSECLQ